MRTRIDRTAEFLRGLVDLPPANARRVVQALVAKEKTQSTTTEQLLDQAAEALQQAIENEITPIIESAAAALPKQA